MTEVCFSKTWSILGYHDTLRTPCPYSAFEMNVVFIITSSQCVLRISYSDKTVSDVLATRLGGGTQQIFVRGGSTPRSNPLPFNIPF